MNLKEKRVFITGASSGIGEELARSLAGEGSKLFLTARRKERLVEIQQELSKKTECHIFPADISDALQRESLAAEVLRVWNGLDILVNNAGVTIHGSFAEGTDEMLRKAFEINFFSVAGITHKLLPLLKKDKQNKQIIYISTPSALHGIPLRSYYSTSKAAGNILMETLRVELKDDLIDVLIFSPGYTKTELRSHTYTVSGALVGEEQHKQAKDVSTVVKMLIQSMKKSKKQTFTDINGTAVYWMRTLLPGTLENILYKMFKKEKPH